MLGDGSSQDSAKTGAYVQRGGTEGAIVERAGLPQSSAGGRTAARQAAEALMRSKALETQRATQRSCVSAGVQGGTSAATAAAATKAQRRYIRDLEAAVR
eukprot:11189344-Lingulodinium_polyedra.AAC.1